MRTFIPHLSLSFPIPDLSGIDDAALSLWRHVVLKAPLSISLK